MLARFTFFSAFLFVICLSSVSAQTGALGQTWKGGAVGAIRSVFAGYKKTAKSPSNSGVRSTSPRNSTAGTRSSGSLKFVDPKPSAVSAMLAEALGRDTAEKKNLTDAFDQLLAAYNSEMRKENKSNDLAAALTFFIVANMATYCGCEPVSDGESEDLYNSIAANMQSLPAVTSMSAVEKHQMHDWLAAMGGFIHAAYLDAKSNGDQAALGTSRELASQATKLVLGVDIAEISAAVGSSSVSSSAGNNSSPSNSPVVGVWTAASTSPAGTSMGTHAGTFRGRYTFKSDGTYAFKSELWGGYSNSNVWWTTEEAGIYSVEGDSLTIVPKTSKATLRNLAGAVQQTKSNPLEKVAYKWTTHYFEGIQETNLVLTPPQKTSRDGVMGGNSLFPNAYLYKQGDNLAWRY
jgi:hypothetical protein